MNAPAALPAAAVPNAADRLRGRMMQKALSVLLDQVRGSRQALPHLAALEAWLGEHGPAVIGEVPRHQLQRMFTQLRVLPLSTEDAVLQDLVRSIQRAIRAQVTPQAAAVPPPEPVAPPPRPKATFDTEATVVISEGSHSDFMRALEGSRPA
jgi:hypothetical protein